MLVGIRRVSSIGFCALVFATLLSCKPAPKQRDAGGALKPINVVLITLDTVRADHLHCYGNANIKTPTIDGLADSGVLFEKAVAQTPLTEPSHASIFTGTNPNVHHVRNTGGFALPPSSVTLATILQKHGWDTAGFISAAVLTRQFGFNQGFAMYDDAIPEKVDSATGQTTATRPANITVDHAIRWLSAQSGKPFFVWLHLYDAHLPYDPPPQFRKKYPNDPYDAEIAFEDQQLGRFLEVLKKKSDSSKTLIILLSDHGEGLGQHGEQNHGIFLYDSTVRIAWIMTGPGIPAGIRVRQQAREIDALPTILDLLGGKASSAVQGTSMVPTFSGKTVPSDYSYEETLYPKINMGWSELRGIHTAHWMYIRAPRPELYDLDQDPGELNNVIANHPKEFRELEAQLKQLSLLGNNNTETVVTSHMDQQTQNQLRSLGYVGGSSGSSIELNGKGPDPKDMLHVLGIFNAVLGIGSEKLSPTRKIDLLQQALKEDPTDPALYSTLGEQYSQIGQNNLALQTYLAALHHGVQSGIVFSLLGDQYLRSGHPQEAILSFQRAVEIDPLNAERQSDLASVYFQTGRLEDAERAYRTVLTIRPYAPAYNGLGVIALKRHDFATARTNFDRAVQLAPDDAQMEYNLGFVCVQTHDFPCARIAFRKFLSNATASDSSIVPLVKAELARLR